MLSTPQLLILLSSVSVCAAQQTEEKLVLQETSSSLFNRCSEIHFEPRGKLQVRQGQAKNLTILINCTDVPADACWNVQLENPLLAVLNDNQICLSASDSNDFSDVMITHKVKVIGRGIGRSRIVATMTTVNGKSSVLPTDYEVQSFRRSIWQITTARIVIAVGIGLNTMAFGCKLEVETIKQYLRRPVGIGISLACQYLLLPTIAYVLGVILNLAPHMALALLTIGCSPGGGPSNMCSALVKGEVNLSIILTLFSTVLALGFIPAWLYGVGNVILRQGYPGERISVPWLYLLGAILWFSVPCVVGVVIRRCSDRIGRFLFRVIRPAALILLLAFFAFALYYMYPIFLFADKWEVIIACCLLPLLGFLLSFGASFLLRQSLRVSVTIMVETGIQNVAIAVLLVAAIIPQPDGDVAGVVPVVVLFVTFAPIIVIFVGITIYGCVKTRKTEDEDEDESSSSSSTSVSSITDNGWSDDEKTKSGLNGDIVNAEEFQSHRF